MVNKSFHYDLVLFDLMKVLLEKTCVPDDKNPLKNHRPVDMTRPLILHQGDYYEMQSMRENMQVPEESDAEQPAAAASAVSRGHVGARQSLIDSLGLPGNKPWHVNATVSDLAHLAKVKELWDEKNPMKMVREAATLGLIMTYKTAKHLIVTTPRKEQVHLNVMVSLCIVCVCVSFSCSPMCTCRNPRNSYMYVYRNSY